MHGEASKKNGLVSRVSCPWLWNTGALDSFRLQWKCGWSWQ